MPKANILRGVFAAAVTPLNPDYSPDLDGLSSLLHFLSTRGCHGVLLTGTTGEGPSFSIEERLMLYRAAADTRQSMPNLRLLAGTGTPSLEETIFLNKSAFDLGFDAVVVLPPYYYRKATDDGLFSWFSQVITKSVPSDGALLGYHIPSVSGVNLSLELLSRLKDSFPEQFLGIKDSSGDSDWARILGETFGAGLTVLTGNDRLLSLALKSEASGCITALANLLSPLLRLVWDNYQTGGDDFANQALLTHAREVFDRYPPAPPLLKALLSRLHGFPTWEVKPPLLSMSPERVQAALTELQVVTG